MSKTLYNYIGNIFKTITNDNDSEFAELSKIIPDINIYFAHPYSFFERGTNEKQNSLVHNFLLKGKSLENVSEEQAEYVKNWINVLPIKILDYATPNEVFIRFLGLFKNVLFSITIYKIKLTFNS